MNRSAKVKEIASFFEKIFLPGEVTELRAIDVKMQGQTRGAVYSGFFDNFEALADAAIQMEPHAKGVYFTANPIDPGSILAGRRGQISPIRELSLLTSDASIQKRRWLLVDLDHPRRPKKKNATALELEETLDGANAISEYLAGLRWPDPIIACSGNGHHLMYMIDLPADDQGTVKRCLQALDARFSSERVKVDLSCFNPARIWKVYGTKPNKGEDTKERPRRSSCVLFFPPLLACVPDHLIHSLASEGTFSRSPAPPSPAPPSPASFDLVRWIADHRLDVIDRGAWNETGRRWTFEICPWNREHTDRAAFICQHPSGAISAGCHHDGCSGQDWHSLRDLVEPGWRHRAVALTPLYTPPAPPSPAPPSPAPPSPEPEKQTDPDLPLQPYALTDWGNAKRLCHYHGQNIKFCYVWERWLVWDGMIWQIDDLGVINTLAKDTVSRIVEECRLTQDTDERKAIFKHGKKSEAGGQMREMVRVAQSEPGIPVRAESLDVDLFKLNLPNGTFDFLSGGLHNHQKKDLCTKNAPVDYVKGADCPTWKKFLSEIFNEDEELISYVQKCLGYSLTGDTSEQCLFILYGSGQNGKSTFIDTVREILGDYFESAEFSTFTLRQNDSGPRNDIASLRGARFVSASEGEEGKRLNESLVKQLTGGEAIKCRFLHKEYFSFIPQFKIWLASNHRPKIIGTDRGIWRRIREIPFTVTIADEKIDRKLPTKLLAEKEGILNWMIEGAIQWMKTGLEPPKVVLDATRSYRESQDSVGSFLAECCELGEEHFEKVGTVYDKYKVWCEDNGEFRLSNRKFKAIMEERGFKQDRLTRSGDRFWVGLVVLDEPQSSEE